MKNLSKFITLILVLSFVLSGCSGNNSSKKSSDGRVEITFINGFTGGDGEYMKRITDGFNKSQDKYRIIESQEKDHYLKFKSGDYDLVVIHGNNMETYRLDGMIQSVDEIYKNAGIKESDFHTVAINLVKLDGKLYGFPLDIHPLTMFYNKEFVSDPPKTYEDLVTLNSQLQTQNKELYALGIPSSGLVEFYALMIAAQNGINLQKGDYLNFAQPSYVDALMTFHDMIWKDKISPSGLGLDGEFKSFMKEAEENKSVQTAVALTGPWFYQAAKEKYGDNLGVAPIPQIGSKAGAYGNSHNIAVSADVKDEKKLAGITEFIKYLYNPDNLINWAEGGQAPTHLPTIEKIKSDPEKYQIAYQNSQQFDSFVGAPAVYQFGEQIRYINEVVFGKVVSEKDLTKEDLMEELKTATEKAKQIAETKPQ